LRADGAAVVAWDEDFGDQTAVLRSGPGAFGPPLTLAPSQPTAGSVTGAGSIGVTGGSSPDDQLPFDDGGAGVRAALPGDGRAVVTWAQGQTTFGVSWNGAAVATQDGDTFTAPQVLGSPLRDVASVAPVIAAGGQPAVAWGDNDRPAPGHLHEA